MDASVSDADATKIPKAESASQDQSLADETGTDFFYFCVYLSRSIHNFSRLFAIPRMNVSDCLCQSIPKILTSLKTSNKFTFLKSGWFSSKKDENQSCSEFQRATFFENWT